MSIQYAGGTIVNTTFTQTTGTRAELAQWVRDQLVNAGWTSSGSATDYVLTSATTPQSLSAAARVYDPGSGNCAKILMRNAGGTKIQAGGLFLLPAASKVWRIIANQYQFFVLTASTSVGREFASGGVPYVPSFVSTTEAIWGGCNTESDTGSAVRNSFRTKLHFGAVNAIPGNNVGIYNGNILEVNNSGLLGNASGGVQLITQSFIGQVHSASGPAVCAKWSDGSHLLSDAIVGWATSSSAVNNTEGRAVGQFWDSMVLLGSWASDTTISFDSRTWYPITLQHTTAVADQAGSLFVAVS